MNAWICPKCGWVHGPGARECYHCNRSAATTSNGTPPLGVVNVPPGAVVVDPEGEIPEAVIQACAQAYRDYRDDVYGRKPSPRLDGDHTAAIAAAGLRAALRAWPQGEK